MAVVAQLVRASVCGTEGRGFKSPLSPHFLSHMLHLPLLPRAAIYIIQMILDFRKEISCVL
jgi:hypothetical protein